MIKAKSTRFPRNAETTDEPASAVECGITHETSPAAGPTRSKYPWTKLDVSELNTDGTVTGPSFFVPGKTQKKFAGTAYQAGKKHGMKFAARQTVRNGVDGVGVWRTE